MRMGPRQEEKGVQRETRIVAEPRARNLVQPERRPLPRNLCRYRLTDLMPCDTGRGAAMLAHARRASHAEKVAGCVAIHLFKGMLDKISRRALPSEPPTREARQQRPEEEVLDLDPAAVVLTLRIRAFLLSRRGQVRLPLFRDMEERRQDRRPQV